MHLRTVSGIALVALILGGCTSLRPSCQPVSRVPFVNEGEGTKFDLEVLQFDDFGVDCSDTQLGRVLKKIRENNSAAPKSGAIVAVFVHGWHHGPTSGNLTSFVRDFLQPLAENEWKRNPQHPRRILGVYIAWRGARWKGAPDFLPASYYDRDAAAKRIGSGDVIQNLVAIMTAAKTGTEGQYTRSVFFGHSMGGLILERALTTAMRSYIPKTFPTDSDEHPWKPPADLVVTLNPAASAMEAWRFNRALAEWKIAPHPRETKYAVGRRAWLPLIVTVVSEGDWATSSVMHAAATLGNRTADFGAANLAGRPLSPAEEKRLLRFSPGFTCDMLTHLVVREPVGTVEMVPRECTDDFLMNATPSPLGWRVRYGASACTKPAVHHAGDPRACAEVGGDRFHLLEIDRPSDPNLYWIMRVPNDVIVGHSEFFTPQSRNLFHSLVAITDAMAVSWEEPEIPRNTYAMTAEGEIAWEAAESLRTSMFGEQEERLASGGPPGACELPPSVGFRSTGACTGTTGEGITCTAPGNVTLTAQPESLAQSACATIEWQIGDKKATGWTAHAVVTDTLRIIMTVRSDRPPRVAEARLTTTAIDDDPPPPPPAKPRITYRGERSGCQSGGPPCRIGEPVVFRVEAETGDPPLEWDFGRGAVYGSLITMRFSRGGRHRIAATARNRAGSTDESIDVDVASCDTPPPAVAIRYRGDESRCTESEGDCIEGELVTYTIDAPADDCATTEWRFSNGDVVTERVIARPLAARERVAVTLKSGPGVSTASAILRGHGRPGDERVPPVQCASCCTFAQKREETHTVAPGDWLSKIALTRYQTLDWSRIYDRNRHILKHPDRIRPGQVLRVPICDRSLDGD